MSSVEEAAEEESPNILTVSNFHLEQALIHDPNIQSGIITKSGCKFLSVDAPDQVDGHTLRQEL